MLLEELPTKANHIIAMAATRFVTIGISKVIQSEIKKAHSCSCLCLQSMSPKPFIVFFFGNA